MFGLEQLSLPFLLEFSVLSFLSTVLLKLVECTNVFSCPLSLIVSLARPVFIRRLETWFFLSESKGSHVIKGFANQMGPEYSPDFNELCDVLPVHV